MRVLVLSNQYHPVVGGIEVMLRQLGPELRARGHELEVVTSSHPDAPDGRSEVDGIAVHRIDMVRALARRDAVEVARCRQQVERICSDFAPDLIHSHDVGPYVWATIDKGVPVLVTLHLGIAAAGAARQGILASLLARCTWVNGVSQAVVDEAVAIVPRIADRVSVITNGLPPTPEPLPPDPQVRRVVAGGRMVPQKGFDVLLRAFAKVVGALPDAQLLLLGDGTERPALAELTRTLGLDRHVSMPGAVRHAEVSAALASASVVAIPSRLEGMPLFALEAAAAGRAVVATPVQGLADVVVDGVTGAHVPPEDVDALALALERLLADPDRAWAMGQAGRARVLSEHSLGATADAYDRLYRSISAPPQT